MGQTSFDPQWELIHKARHWGKYPNENLVRFVFRNYPRPFDKLSAVDLGCGAGAQTMFMGREGFNVIGVDASQSAIDRCIQQKWTDSTLDTTHFKCCDVTKLPMETASVDLVTDVCCLQHLSADDAVVAVGEVARVLKAGGKFFSISTRWADTTGGDTPIRKMRRGDIAHIYCQQKLKYYSLDFDVLTDGNEERTISHWLIAMVNYSHLD